MVMFNKPKYSYACIRNEKLTVDDYNTVINYIVYLCGIKNQRATPGSIARLLDNIYITDNPSPIGDEICKSQTGKTIYFKF